MSKANPGAGDVLVEFGDDILTLRPTLQAAIKLSNAEGGLAGLVNRCVQLQFESIFDVLVVGSGMTVDADTKQKVFEVGLINLHGSCIEFLNLLANGGRPIGDTDKGEKDPLESSSP
jgi:hypothetical protein